MRYRHVTRTARQAFRAAVLDELETEYGPDVAADANAAFSECRCDPFGVAIELDLAPVPRNARRVAAHYAEQATN